MAFLWLRRDNFFESSVKRLWAFLGFYLMRHIHEAPMALRVRQFRLRVDCVFLCGFLFHIPFSHEVILEDRNEQNVW